MYVSLYNFSADGSVSATTIQTPLHQCETIRHHFYQTFLGFHRYISLIIPPQHEIPRPFLPQSKQLLSGGTHTRRHYEGWLACALKYSHNSIPSAEYAATSAAGTKYAIRPHHPARKSQFFIAARVPALWWNLIIKKWHDRKTFFSCMAAPLGTPRNVEYLRVHWGVAFQHSWRGQHNPGKP